MDTNQKNRPSPGPEQRKKANSGGTGRPVQNRGSSTARKQAAAGVKKTAPLQQTKRPDAAAKTKRPMSAEQAKRMAMRKRSAQRSQERQKQQKHRRSVPAVVYTQPRPFNLNRLLMQLAIILAVVLAVTMGLSVFFKVKTVKVYGNSIYSAWVVQEASGIKQGDNLMSINNPRACGKIDAALPYVKNVRIGINLPDTVNIYIEELKVAYAIQSVNDIWWLITSDGTVVESIDGGTAGSYTKIYGIKLDNPLPGEAAVAYEEPVSTDPTEAEEETSIVELPNMVLVTAREKLDAALTIVETLEQNDIVGEAASVDVTSLTAVELWYGQRYHVKFGNMENLEYKIAAMKSAISQMSEYQMGNLDVSFTNMPDQVVYTPFE